MHSQAPQAAAALAKMITNSSFSLTVHTVSSTLQHSCQGQARFHPSAYHINADSYFEVKAMLALNCSL